MEVWLKLWKGPKHDSRSSESYSRMTQAAPGGQSHRQPLPAMTGRPSSSPKMSP